jgi:Arc/MetJ-type ribon-helix-helix transcriptional regulator
MIIELNPEDELLVQRRLQSGAYASIEDVIHRALESLDADEMWLQENNAAIHEQIGVGLAQLDRGEDFPRQNPALGSKRRKPPG